MHVGLGDVGVDLASAGGDPGVVRVDLGAPGVDLGGRVALRCARWRLRVGGGALTREKILAYSSSKFICIVDDTKHADLLGKFPLPIEVLEIARSAISREIMKMGGRPVYRNKFITDNGNQIIDVHNFPIRIPLELEEQLNNIPGVVENGIFSNRKADIIINANKNGLQILER